ncbi:hypothetical protein [Paenibacillus sp. S150]|uniref:hypothetical protein n=1 Tax=Paenibacillus sp. S150 TaxID=2749826 RepID=UPI001C5605C5|nr:hypothetical protein [Paenibacillus sp. S150]MBW4083596.1 hypothetical protein [Paenibacillus sp. S150]
MTQVQTMTNPELNRALAELMGYTVKSLTIGDNGKQLYALVTPMGRERLPASTIDKAYLDAPDYCTDPAASLEVQTAARKIDPEGYALNLANQIQNSMIRKITDPYYGTLVAAMCDASPRERAEAAYITLSSKQ